MTDSEKRELIHLLEYRTLSDFERRKRRLQAIPMSIVGDAIERAHKSLPLTTEQYIAVNLGFLPGQIPKKSHNP